MLSLRPLFHHPRQDDVRQRVPHSLARARLPALGVYAPCPVTCPRAVQTRFGGRRINLPIHSRLYLPKYRHARPRVRPNTALEMREEIR